MPIGDHGRKGRLNGGSKDPSFGYVVPGFAASTKHVGVALGQPSHGVTRVKNGRPRVAGLWRLRRVQWNPLPGKAGFLNFRPAPRGIGPLDGPIEHVSWGKGRATCGIVQYAFGRCR